VSQLPVEDGSHAIATDQQVAVAEVAVDDHLAGGLGAGVGEEAEGEVERSPGLIEAVVDGPERVELVATLQARDAVHGDAMEAGEDLPALAGQHRPHLRVLGVPEDLAGDGLALEALHHDEVVARPFHCWDGNPSVGGSGEQRGLHAHAATKGTGRIAPQDQRANGAVSATQVERPGLPRGAARQSAKALHLATEEGREVVEL
jgi:hypothetical protein